MEYKDRTKEKFKNDLEGLSIRVEDMGPRGAGRRQDDEALKVSETRYRRLFESAQDGILLLDANTGQILDVNPFLLNMLGYSQEDFLGKKLWGIGPFSDIAASRLRFSELQTKGYVRYEHLPLQSKDSRLIDVEFVSNVYLVDNKKVSTTGRAGGLISPERALLLVTLKGVLYFNSFNSIMDSFMTKSP